MVGAVPVLLIRKQKLDKMIQEFSMDNQVQIRLEARVCYTKGWFLPLCSTSLWHDIERYETVSKKGTTVGQV
jgi:hypothetical protein